MDLRQLRYFTGVVENGSFSKAALNLHVAQPALSQHVRHMEEELGVQLLHRGAHGVTATEAGERLLRHAKRILAEFAELPDAVRGVALAPRGEVRFGMPGTVSELLAAPLIEAAREAYPDVRIRIVEAMSGYVLDWMKRGEVDLAMIYNASDTRGLSVHHGLSEEICLFAARDMTHPASLDERAGEAELRKTARLPLILPGAGHGLRDLIDAAATAARLTIAPEIEIDSYGQIKKLVQRKLGYGLLPRMAVQREEIDGEFRVWRIVDPVIARRVYLAYSTERPLLTAPRAIGQLAWTILTDLVRSGTWIATPGEADQAPNLFRL